MERLSTHQFMVLSSAVLLGTTFFPLGSMMTRIAGRDGWMAILPGFALGIPFGLMVLSLMPKYPGKNFLEITEKVLGKWLGKGFGLLYILVTTYFGSILSGQGVDMFNRTILPLMPRYIFVLGGTLLIFLLYLNGIEVLGRFSEVVFPIITVALILTAILTIPRFEQGELFPILANGIKPVLSASVKVAPFPMEYILFLAGILPFLSQQAKDIKKMKRGIWNAVLLIVGLDTILVLIQIMTFGPFETIRLNYGLLVLGKMIEVTRTVSGVESIFALIWMGALTIKLVAFFFEGMWGMKSVFGCKNVKWSFLLGLVYIFIPLLYSRGTDITVEIAVIDEYLILPFTTIWVLLVWGVDRWKNRSQSL
jgi:spore germination protein (amino acid permease)